MAALAMMIPQKTLKSKNGRAITKNGIDFTKDKMLNQQEIAKIINAASLYHPLGNNIVSEYIKGLIKAPGKGRQTRFSVGVILQHMLEICAPALAAPQEIFARLVATNLQYLDTTARNPMFEKALELANDMVKRQEQIDVEYGKVMAGVQESERDYIFDKISVKTITPDELDAEDNECPICHRSMRPVMETFLQEFLPMLPLKQDADTVSEIKEASKTYYTQLAKLEKESATAKNPGKKLIAQMMINSLCEGISKRISTEWIDAKKYELVAGLGLENRFQKIITVTKCGHKYCQDCLRDWVAEKMPCEHSMGPHDIACPYCRTVLHQASVTPEHDEVTEHGEDTEHSEDTEHDGDTERNEVTHDYRQRFLLFSAAIRNRIAQRLGFGG